MKILFIRFFYNKEDSVPRHSLPICKSIDTKTRQEANILEQMPNLFDWMNQYPNGKVDYVWL